MPNLLSTDPLDAILALAITLILAVLLIGVFYIGENIIRAKKDRNAESRDERDEP